MTSGTAHLWIRSADGELTRSDAITWSRCRGGEVEAARPDGTVIRLAGPGCPSTSTSRCCANCSPMAAGHDDRWIVVITAEVTPGTARWAGVRLDELAEISGRGGPPGLEG